MDKLLTNNKKLDGYVLYSKNDYNSDPFGIVSSDFKRKATCNQFPNYLKFCLIEIEDKRFYKHNGVDYRGIIRALLANIKAKKIVQGGSTITQQLARNLRPTNKRTFFHKLQETLRARQLEKTYTKEEILNLYFNNVYFGNNLYGIRAASLGYFCKEPLHLTHAEQLFLITLLRGPNFYLKRINNAAHARFKLLNKNITK